MYEYAIVEEKWRRYWSEHKTFFFEEKNKDKPLYIIDTPPPFTNGSLHMGQAFWVSYVDALARYKHMRQFNVLYPQGWDAHGFPTETAVEKKYGRNLGREEFYKKCVEESETNIATMKDEMIRLGASFDPRYEYKTTTDDYISKVQLSVLDMYENGFVYRAFHPVEWCVKCKTSISREQADEIEEETQFNYLSFAVKDDKKKTAITIATTRPELLHACVALAVNPDDKRYAALIGKSAIVPLFNRHVPIIADEIVDKEFGTGAEMICTFGDKRDISLYYKHKLELVESMESDGKLKNADKFNGIFVGKARAEIIAALKSDGLLIKQEKLKHSIKIHDRCSTPIEFISSMQYFIKIKEHAEKIREMANTIEWFPPFAKQRLDDWSNFIEWDWAISRNRVFGTAIPFWHCSKCNQIIPAQKEKLPVDPMRDDPPIRECPKCGGEIVAEGSTLDGWIDSSITPLVVSGWPDHKELLERGFPTAVRIQGTDIIRTWAFYTIFRTWALTKQKPWHSIISHGMILAPDGREMHKSFGNGVYPSELMKKYSTDAIRLWVALCGGIVKDKPFSYQDMDFAKSFTNKLFNTANFVKLAIGKGKSKPSEPSKDLNVFDYWILNRLNAVTKEVSEAYDSYALYEAMSKVVNFYWHEFADYYIENVKHRIYSEDKAQEKSKEAAIFTLRHVCTTSIKLLAPVIPHICEEINAMFARGSVFAQEWPKYSSQPAKASYVINGYVQKLETSIDPESVGAFLNGIIADIRKQKANARVALNKEVSSININVPDEYYSAIEYSKGEIASICKATAVNIKKGEYSLEMKI